MSIPLPTAPLGRREFIALVAMLMAIVAFTIDSMLPAMGLIAEDLTPDAPVRAQLIVPFFVIGLGIGTFFTGPLSDAFGRRPVVIVGGMIYLLGSLLCWMAPSLELLLAARALQGLGASGARVVALAIVRDRYSGREMAQITSFVIMVFTLVPAVAPTMGAGLIWLFGWHGISASFLVFAIAVGLWFYARQPETLRAEDRRKLRLNNLAAAVSEVLANALVRRVVLVQICVFGMLFTLLAVSQPVFDLVMGQAAQFHIWFGAVALVAMAGAMLNAKIVVRFGMERIARLVLWVHVAGTLVYIFALQSDAVALADPIPFFLWLSLSFSSVSMVVGNLNAIALQPMGHLAGTASSVVTAASTVGAGVLAIPASGLFHDSQTPVLWAILAMILVARVLMMGRLFRPEPQPV